MSEKNLSHTFTKTNLVKTLKGAAIAAAGAFALFILDWVGALEFSDPILTGFIAWFAPTAINAVKEYLSDR